MGYYLSEYKTDQKCILCIIITRFREHDLNIKSQKENIISNYKLV